MTAIFKGDVKDLLAYSDEELQPKPVETKKD
jgi:hypothetical protein